MEAEWEAHLLSGCRLGLSVPDYMGARLFTLGVARSKQGQQVWHRCL
jgi:hypothetical protein